MDESTNKPPSQHSIQVSLNCLSCKKQFQRGYLSRKKNTSSGYKLSCSYLTQHLQSNPRCRTYYDIYFKSEKSGDHNYIPSLHPDDQHHLSKKPKFSSSQIGLVATPSIAEPGLINPPNVPYRNKSQKAQALLNHQTTFQPLPCDLPPSITLPTYSVNDPIFNPVDDTPILSEPDFLSNHDFPDDCSSPVNIVNEASSSSTNNNPDVTSRATPPEVNENTLNEPLP